MPDAPDDDAPLDLPEVALPPLEPIHKRAAASFRWHARPEHQTALYRVQRRLEAVGVGAAAVLGVVWSLAQLAR